MLFRVLGTLDIDSEGGPLSAGGPVPRRVLTALLARAGNVVPVDGLLDAAWGDEPPPSAERSLQSHLTRLREVVAAADPTARVERQNGGYRLAVDLEQIDATRFERLVRESDDVAPRDAVARLREALALWRGPSPYADLQDTAYPSAEAGRLVDLRGSAADLLAKSLLEAGESDAAATECQARLADDPYRERLWEILVVALYRQGRQVDALDAYRRARRELDEGLGIEPGPRLRELESLVLAQDPSLLATARVVRQPCPYKGLARYDVGDADLYVGREALVEEVLARLVDRPVVVVVGPSGAGKSSLVRAGLVPALAAGGLPGSADWPVRVIVPGDDPVPALRSALADPPQVLVVDQVEEALIADGGDRVQEVGDLVMAASSSGVRFVLAVRADFYGRLAEHPGLARQAGSGSVLVGPPTDDELRRIVIEPATRVGLRVEPALADLVVNEVRGRPGALPVLSTALVRSWEHREDGTLTVAAYRAGGGVEAALQRVGEEAWSALAGDDQRTACRRMLLRLASYEDGQWVRRRARRTEVAPAGDAAAVAALEVLADRRLVVARADDVEIAHEALLTGWPRLLGWLEDGRARAGVRERLAVAAIAWDADGRDETALYAGTRLQAALDAEAASPSDLTALEKTFLATSSVYAERTLTEQRERADREARGRRRVRAVAAGLAGALVLAAAAGGFAVHQREEAQASAGSAEAAARDADAGRLGVLARTGGAYDLALLLAAQAATLDPSPQTDSDLFSTLLRGDAVIATFRAPEPVEDLAFTPDGTSIMAIGTFGNVTQWAASGGPPQLQAGTDGGQLVRALAFDASGTPVVGVGGGPVLWDVKNRKPLDVAPLGAAPGRWALMADGRTVAAAHLDAQFHYDNTLLLWKPRPGPGTERSRAVSLPGVPSPDFENVQACGAYACVLLGTNRGSGVYLDHPALARVRLSDGHLMPLLTLPDDMTQLLVASPDGRYAAYTEPDGIVRLVDLRTLRTTELNGETTSGRPLAFSRDARYLAGGDGTAVLIWDLAAGGLPRRTDVSGGQVAHAAFSPDGTTLATWSTDGAVLVWDIGGRRSVGSVVTEALSPADNPVDTSTVWPVEGRVAIGQFDGPDGPLLEFVDTATGTVVPVVPSPHRGADYVPTARSGREGRTLVSVDDLGRTAVWSVDPVRLLGAVALPAPASVPLPAPHQDETRSYAPDVWVSPDGRRAAAIRTDAGIQLIDLASRTVVQQLPPLPDLEHTTSLQILGWSADGRSILVNRGIVNRRDTEVEIVDATTGAVRITIPVSGTYVNEAAADPTGRFIAMVLGDGTLRVVGAHDGKDLTTPLHASDGEAINVSISPDGRWISVSAQPAQVTVWDTRTFRQVGSPLPLNIGARDARARFGPDGRLYVASGRTLRAYAIDPQQWLDRACREAGRTLTEQEWAQYIPDHPYAPACAVSTSGSSSAAP